MFRTLSLNLRLFLEGAFLSYVALFRWLRPMTYLASKIVMPLASILFFTFLGTYATSARECQLLRDRQRDPDRLGQRHLRRDDEHRRRPLGRDAGLPVRHPANRLPMFVGRAFMHIIDGILGVVIGLGWGVILLGLDLSHTDSFASALTILVTTFSTSGLGLLLGCVSLVSLNGCSSTTWPTSRC